MGTPVTQQDLDAVADVPIKTALNYLETLERERRGLHKVGEILRAVRQAQQVRAGAEREATRLQQEQAAATATREVLRALVAAEQARLDGLKAAIGETDRRLGAARQAADEEEAAIERRLYDRRADADRARPGLYRM